MIKQAYLMQVTALSGSADVAEKLWQEIELAYTGANRHFHNLLHLEHMLNELQPLQSRVEDWPTLLFSICYHDVVYDVIEHMVADDKEERSAAFAERHLQQIGYPQEKIDACKAQIMATQKHTKTNNYDTNLLIDADLSILGQSWRTYAAYKNNIREEYSIYLDNIYKAGRRKVLEHFLRMEPLFKTAHFHKRYEGSAKENIRKELALLES
jgi:predicted metal-dependent HD superfamily phosphohydrolase